jgi:hypothetical protein
VVATDWNETGTLILTEGRLFCVSSCSKGAFRRTQAIPKPTNPAGDRMSTCVILNEIYEISLLAALPLSCSS